MFVGDEANGDDAIGEDAHNVGAVFDLFMEARRRNSI